MTWVPEGRNRWRRTGEKERATADRLVLRSYVPYAQIGSEQLREGV